MSALRSSPRKRRSSSAAAAIDAASLPPSPPGSTSSTGKASVTSSKAAVAPATKPKRTPRRQRDESVDESELDCLACPPPGAAPPTPGPGATADRETWVSCSHCKQWFHCICVRLPNPQDYAKWYCPPCIAASVAIHADASKQLRNVERPPPRKSKRARLEVDYAAIQEGMPADPIGRWRRLLDNADVMPDRFRRMKGSEWTIDWLLRDDKALSEPVLVPARHRASTVASSQPAKGRSHAHGTGGSSVKPERTAASPTTSKSSAEGRPTTPSSSSIIFEPETTSIPGMLVPPSSMTIADIAGLIGPDTPVEVIDVATQSSSKAWTLSAWADYCALPKERRKKVLNVISLEVTGTPMERLVEAPQLVRDVDWVTRDWPAAKRGPDAREHSWPKVQRYVLMGVEGGYSDWHVDFAGSSVYYHVVYGQKTFLFAPPTPHNLAAYRTWCSSTRQDFDWLGDHVQGLRRVDIMPGETMLIPSGWLHSVYTPTDTLVVGGNFLTDWNVETQWKLVEIEEQTKVPRKFRFPHLRRLTWYVAKGWADRLGFLRVGEGEAGDEAGDEDDGGEEEQGDDVNAPASSQPHASEPDDATLVEHLPPRRVLLNLQRLLTTLSDDIDLVLDPYEADEKTAKLKKQAKDAIPHDAVGSVQEAAALVRLVERRCERGLELVDRVEALRRKRKAGGARISGGGTASPGPKNTSPRGRQGRRQHKLEGNVGGDDEEARATANGVAAAVVDASTLDPLAFCW
ncbi:uncharacterized protein PFL1_01420 [Pseudozyma flocculosa PF-1]|uniref:JmjC domain-containing histone demethylation protein 1 n=1 Tax=Pseudozyma flocculosa TaxID=84751 RepID=A0A5C3EVJ9_9BASI|nr:uncharacterized protein PFL1_01420 [Pseudozyma flocculosa PF-1]EPQ31235.1 hypothetical protein PFL1_01420 [Pseudozyma flocculosa PF-1]SPO36268.1 related to JHD1 - JmjC domain family histone demethylase [Pseudozyma flocculosa]